MENKITDDDLMRYAGSDFGEPQLVSVEKLYLNDFDVNGIDELIDALVEFRRQHPGIVKIGHDEDGMGCIHSLEACRLETASEVEARLAKWRERFRADRDRWLRQHRAKFG